MSKLKQLYAIVSDTTKHIPMSRKYKKLILVISATLFLVAAIIGIVAGVNSHNKSSNNATSMSSHAIVKSSCSSTLYPELCFSAIANTTAVTQFKITSQKDVIELSLNLTTEAVKHNYFNIKELLLTRKNLTEREQTALHDCLETIDETLEELQKAEEDLNVYPNKKSLYQHADDLKTVISSAITNQVTCLDGFSYDAADKHVREALQQGEVHVEHMCSNALAIINSRWVEEMRRLQRR